MGISLKMPRGAYLSWILLVVLSMIWGSSFILIRKGLQVYTPDQVAAIRIGSGFFASLPIALIQLRKVQWKRLKWLFLSGLQGNFLPAFLFAFAQTRIESSMAGILNALTPLFTLSIGTLFYKQTASLSKLAGVIIGLVGCVWLILTRQAEFSFQANVFALLIVIATLLYGSNVNLLKFRLQDLHPMITSSVALFLVGPIALIYLFQTDVVDRTLNAPGAAMSLLAILALGILSTALALVLFNRLLQISSTLFASSVTYLIPIVSVGWGFFLSEQIGWIEVGGMLVILAGVLIVHRAH